MVVHQGPAGVFAARDLAAHLPRQHGPVTRKPPAAWPKIVDGKLEKFYQESCLMEQAFIKDPAVMVKDLLAQKIAKIGENMNIRRFTRYQLGEA